MANQQQDVLTPDSFINESNDWPEKIYEIDEQDYVHGGEHGYSNVPHEQLANRTYYLKTEIINLTETVNNFKNEVNTQNSVNLDRFNNINNQITNLNDRITSVKNELTEVDTTLTEEIIDLQNSVKQLQDDLLNHVHNYAGSNSPGGPANEVSTDITETVVNLVGVSETEPTKLKQTSGIKAANGVIQANQFTGNLTGNATSASKIKDSINITLNGDITSTPVITNLNNDININTVISNTGVKDGHYGPLTNLTVTTENASFSVPSIKVDKSGRITEAEDFNITINNNARSNTAGAQPSNNKLYIIGAKEQSDIAETFSNNKVFTENGQLYSNNNPVVDTNSTQNLDNKIYNGYVLGPACEYEVDNTVGGTIASNALITSGAVAGHEHKYAKSDTINGPASEVKIVSDIKNNFPLVNSGSDNKVKVNNTITMGNNTIRVNNMYVDEQLTIPGGQLWIDTAVESTGASIGMLISDKLNYDDAEIRQIVYDNNQKVTECLNSIGTAAYKDVDYFAPAHDHPYLNLSGGQMTGTIKGHFTPGTKTNSNTGLILEVPGITPKAGIYNGTGTGANDADLIIKAGKAIGFVDVSSTNKGMTVSIDTKTGNINSSSLQTTSITTTKLNDAIPITSNNYDTYAAKKVHTHDDRYYTESEIDTKLSNITSETNTKLNNMNSETTTKLNNMNSTIDELIRTLLPVGSIIAFSGNTSKIPKDWHICDGTNNTPDLRDIFLVGAGKNYDLGTTGGEASVTLTTNQMPVHNHYSAVADSRGYLGYFRSRSNTYYPAGPSSTLGYASTSGCFEAVETGLRSEGNADDNSTEYIVGLKANKLMNDQGGGQSHENRPPYYAVYYIMKIK